MMSSWARRLRIASTLNPLQQSDAARLAESPRRIDPEDRDRLARYPVCHATTHVHEDAHWPYGDEELYQSSG
jgi:hypothetical protein